MNETEKNSTAHRLMNNDLVWLIAFSVCVCAVAVTIALGMLGVIDVRIITGSTINDTILNHLLFGK